jgi:hypothetical protein
VIVEEPEIVIVIEGGIVQAVATVNKQLTYRIIDLDTIKTGDQGVTDEEADATGIDVEEYTKGMTKETG